MRAEFFAFGSAVDVRMRPGLRSPRCGHRKTTSRPAMAALAVYGNELYRPDTGDNTRNMQTGYGNNSRNMRRSMEQSGIVARDERIPPRIQTGVTVNEEGPADPAARTSTWPSAPSMIEYSSHISDLFRVLLFARIAVHQLSP